jgi:two-component system, oxyanion-binding sensor
VELSREVGWATIREKIRLGELDAAQAPAPMLWAMRLGLGCAPCNVLTAFVLNQNGNALTLAKALGPQAQSGDGLREIVRARRRPLTMGAVYTYSSHHLLIREWMRRSGLALEKDVRIVIIPPAQMFRNLVAGTIDGYAAGEPWNSLAVRDGAGWCPLWSAAVGSPQVEKVLLVTRKFSESRASEHAAIVSSLAESAAWCDVPRNRGPLATLMSEPGHVDLSVKIIAPTLLGRFDAGMGTIESVPDFHIFNRGAANVPTAAKSAEIQAALQSSGLISRAVNSGLSGELMREELYAAAVRSGAVASSPRN